MADDGQNRARSVTRVLVVDDHKAVAESLAIAIGVQADLESVGIASTLEEAARLVDEKTPDVVLMDLRLPDGDGIEGTSRVKALRPSARVVILTAHGDPEWMARAASAGASGFLQKTSPVAQILDAIRAAGAGGMLVERSALAGMIEHIRGTGQGNSAGDVSRMTAREMEVLRLMGEGMDPSGIAKRLGIKLSTCRGYVQSILAKLEVHSQLEAVVVAVRRGLISAPRGIPDAW
ncbi:MAG: response regulator transcription factor [Actinomycetota bacterium]